MERMYSVEEYKDMLKRFVETAPECSILYSELFWSKDLFSMNLDEMKYYIVNEVLSNSDSLKYLQNMRNKMSRFYEWAVKEKKIKYNVWETDEYLYSIFVEEMIDRMDIKVWYEEDIESLIAKFRENKPFYEMLIRGFYEGIESGAEFARIRVQDIDFDSNTIHMQNKEFKMSDKLSKVVNQYIYYEDWNDMYATEQCQDRLIKTSKLTSEEKYDMNARTFISYTLKKISDTYGIKISAQDLTASGFINYAHARCVYEHKSDLFFIKMFELGAAVVDRRLENKIKIFATDYGFTCNKQSQLLRMRFYPYVYHGKWYTRCKS